MQRTAVCFAPDRTKAEQIVEDLRHAGLANEEISTVVPGKASPELLRLEKHSKAPEGLSAGAVTGGILGGILGWLAGVGILTIGGIGPLLAAGPIMAALSGLGAGATAGGIAGALVGLGIPEYEATEYEKKIREGNILISVHSTNEETITRATHVFESAGAEDITVTEDTRPVSSRSV